MLKKITMCFNNYDFSFKSILLSFIGLFILFTLMVSCDPYQNRYDRRNIGENRVLTNDGLYAPTSCGRRNTYSDKISITDIEFVDSNNVANYLLQGECKNNLASIFIAVNGYRIDENPKCSGGKWRVTLDLTPVVDKGGGDRVAFFVSQNLDKNRVRIKDERDIDSRCEEVRVAFRGPEDYIPIPALTNQYESGFYVMKYEAKVDAIGRPEARAVSKPEGRPISRVSYRDALELCQNNGSRYDLMKNAQWQNIALSIEEINENWANGRASPTDDNALNCGVFHSTPRHASSNDEDDCATHFCNKERWDPNRRTHILPNGEKIWDMCGNVGEMMKDKYNADEKFGDFIYKLSPKLKRLFGPRRTYKVASDSGRRVNTWNLGYAEIKSNKNLIVRGMPNRDAGIFSVDITDDQDNKRAYASNIGFRCVYVP